MKPSWRMSRQFPSLTWKMPNSAATTQTILMKLQIRRTSQERWCTAVLIPKLIFRKPSTSQTKPFLLVKRSFHPCTGKRWNEQHWEVIFSKFQVLVFIVYHDISGKVYLSPSTHVHVVFKQYFIVPCPWTGHCLSKQQNIQVRKMFTVIKENISMKLLLKI